MQQPDADAQLAGTVRFTPVRRSDTGIGDKRVCKGAFARRNSGKVRDYYYYYSENAIRWTIIRAVNRVRSRETWL